MSGWKAKRFWKEATVVRDGDGWGVRLDGRAVKTPAKAAMILPTEAMAQAIAAEWDAQQGEIRPETMPVTRAANAAIDKVAVQFDEVAQMLAEYGGTDLLCYRATGPEVLAERQARQWDPLLAWAAERFGAPLVSTSGVIPVTQSPDSIARLKAELVALDPFRLTAVHDLVTIPGSLVIGLAMLHGHLDLEAAWAAARVDETWQAEVWGHDDEAADIETRKKAELQAAAQFLGMC